MNRAYIVIGASGGLGKLVVDRLLANGDYVLSSQQSRDTRNHPHGTVFTGDLKSNLEGFLAYTADYVRYTRTCGGIETYGLFNAIGIPVRVAGDASGEEKSRVVRESMRINCDIPLRIANHFAGLVGEGSVVFLSSQHTVEKTKGKEPYWKAKLALEEAAVRLAKQYPKLRVNTILPGNLGLGMSAAKRADYEKEGTLVDVGMIVDICFKYLVSPGETGKRILVAADEGVTVTREI